MFLDLAFLLVLALRTRAQLAAENLFLRKLCLERKVENPARE